jgi:hypothetical protein
MALKPGRTNSTNTEIRFVSSTSTTAEAGQILTYSTAGSGQLTLGTRPILVKSTNPSGQKPAGMVMHDIISLDETVTHRNWHKYVQKQGEAVEIAKKESYTTNSYVGVPTAGATAYLGSSGLLCVTPSVTGGLVANPIVGEFEGVADEDGYVSVRIELPHKLS